MFVLVSPGVGGCFVRGKKGGMGGGIAVPEREDALMKTARYGGWIELQIRFWLKPGGISTARTMPTIHTFLPRKYRA